MLRSILLGVLLLVPGIAQAGPVDPNQTLLCAVTEAVECVYEESCSHGSADTLNFPAFVKIDLKKKTLTEHGGSGRQSSLEVISSKVGPVVLQGYENRAFSITIARETGRLTATASDVDAGFVLFGVCTNL